MDNNQCQAIKQWAGTEPGGDRCPKVAKRAAITGLHRGVRLLCSQHANMARSLRDVADPLETLDGVATELIASLIKQEEAYQQEVSAEISRLQKLHLTSRARTITAQLELKDRAFEARSADVVDARGTT